MEDEGVVLGPALGLEDAADRRRVQAVGPQAVDCFRGDAHKATLPEKGGGGFNILFCQKLRLYHGIT